MLWLIGAPKIRSLGYRHAYDRKCVHKTLPTISQARLRARTHARRRVAAAASGCSRHASSSSVSLSVFFFFFTFGSPYTLAHFTAPAVRLRVYCSLSLSLRIIPFFSTGWTRAHTGRLLSHKRPPRPLLCRGVDVSWKDAVFSFIFLALALLLSPFFSKIHL